MYIIGNFFCVISFLFNIVIFYWDFFVFFMYWKFVLLNMCYYEINIIKSSFGVGGIGEFYFV